MSNESHYKWRWISYLYQSENGAIIAESSNWYSSKTACFQSACMNVPFKGPTQHWGHVHLHIIENTYDGKVSEKHLITL